jgi:hypothetical protein
MALETNQPLDDPTSLDDPVEIKAYTAARRIVIDLDEKRLELVLRTWRGKAERDAGLMPLGEVPKEITYQPVIHEGVQDVDGTVIVPETRVPSFDEAMEDPAVKAAVDVVLTLAYSLVKTYSPEFEDAEDV